MNHLKNPLVIIGVIALIFIAVIGWNYTEAIKNKNEIEREKIASDERMKQTELDQAKQEADAKLQVEKDAADAKATADIQMEESKKSAEAQRQSVLATCLAKAQDEYNRRAAQGPIFGDGPLQLMESKKSDCQRQYGN